MHPVFEGLGGPGLPECTSTNPVDFRAENNAWCVIANQGTELSSTPFLFMRNVVRKGTGSAVHWELSDEAPFGQTLFCCIYRDGGVYIGKPTDLAKLLGDAAGKNILRP